MKTKIITAAFLAALALPSPATVTIDYVTVGNTGNAADPLTGYGSVSYEYNIGKYEVTNAQYTEFLNAKGASNDYGIYNTTMASCGIVQNGSSGSFSYGVVTGFENRPVAMVSWYDAARFANWLHNGQGSGDMETGVYTLSGNTGIITKSVGATVWIPSADEWYKSAYYNGENSIYSRYPNGQNTITSADANTNMSIGEAIDVGSYAGDGSYYGTFDQGGNVQEWNDRVYAGNSRGLAGGTWADNIFADDLNATAFPYKTVLPNYEGNPTYPSNGFRLAAAIPEPSTSLIAALGLFPLLSRRRKA